MIEPDFTSTGFPIHSAKQCTPRQRRVHFASQLTVEAHIPRHPSERLVPAKSPRLSLEELKDRVDSVRQEISRERAVFEREKQIADRCEQQHESLLFAKKHLGHLARLTIQDLRSECDKLDKSISKMKLDMSSLSQSHGDKAVRRRSKQRKTRECHDRDEHCSTCSSSSPTSVRAVWTSSAALWAEECLHSS